MEFSQMALQKLLQLFPELSSYIVSFKDLSEETGKAQSGLKVGIFILQLGQEYYYIPVLSKNNIILPMDSLFGATESKFVPLTRAFLDQVISGSQVSLGNPAKIPATVTQNPSVYDLVTPPRTGKFVYASSSRLVDFLSAVPNMVKKAMLDKFSADKEIYDSLHNLFGLESILAALQPSVHAPKIITKPAIEILRSGKGLDQESVQSILNKGYCLRGEHITDRVAILGNDNDDLNPLRNLSCTDAGFDYDVMTVSGEAKSAYIPARSVSAPRFTTFNEGCDRSLDPVFAIFSNGDYAISGHIISRGEPGSSKKVIKDLLSYRVPIVPKQVIRDDDIVIFSPTLELIGVYNIRSVIESNLGVTLIGNSLLPEHGHSYKDITINAYRNCTTINAQNSDNVFIPYNTLVVNLRRSITHELEVNVNSAANRLELSSLLALGSAADIGYDGVEYSFNGKSVGSEANIIEKLVIGEGISPDHAESFVKQAQVKRKVKIYLSKRADFAPGEIPQFGENPPEQVNNFGPGTQSSFATNVKNATKTNDAQTVESTIISELIQATNMTDLVREYLPDIQEAIDKLGRTLFLARLNMDQLAQAQNASELLSFISNLRNVYRLLGDNCIKLQRMVSGPEEEILNKDNKVTR